MKLQMHSIHFDADRKLLDYIQKKAEKLDTFYDRITGGEVFLRINRDTASHENKVIEIKMTIARTIPKSKNKACILLRILGNINSSFTSSIGRFSFVIIIQRMYNYF